MKGETIGNGAGLRMTPDDDVVTAIDDLDAGRSIEIDGETIELAEDIPFGHKFAIRHIDAGDEIYKYGYVIAKASQPIPPGTWVHTHNTESTRGRGDLAHTESEPA